MIDVEITPERHGEFWGNLTAALDVDGRDIASRLRFLVLGNDQNILDLAAPYFQGILIKSAEKDARDHFLQNIRRSQPNHGLRLVTNEPLIERPGSWYSAGCWCSTTNELPDKIVDQVHHVLGIDLPEAPSPLRLRVSARSEQLTLAASPYFTYSVVDRVQHDSSVIAARTLMPHRGLKLVMPRREA